MRIIAGSCKGAHIFAPKGLDTRPTADRVREAAFNLLGPGAAEDANVLDLFAGSGAMGLEALSRGAARAVFVEADPAACRTIERNLERLRQRVTGQPHLRNLDHWSILLQRGDVLGLHRVLTGLDRHSIEMREVSPMSGLLSADQRADVLAKSG